MFDNIVRTIYGIGGAYLSLGSLLAGNFVAAIVCACLTIYLVNDGGN